MRAQRTIAYARAHVLALALAVASTLGLATGCDDDDGPTVDAGGSVDAGVEGGAPDPGPDAAPAQLVFKDWVHDLVTTWHKETTDPDTLNDKEDRLLFTEDETAFDDVLKE